MAFFLLVLCHPFKREKEEHFFLQDICSSKRRRGTNSKYSAILFGAENTGKGCVWSSEFQTAFFIWGDRLRREQICIHFAIRTGFSHSIYHRGFFSKLPTWYFFLPKISTTDFFQIYAHRFPSHNIKSVQKRHHSSTHFFFFFPCGFSGVRLLIWRTRSKKICGIKFKFVKKKELVGNGQFRRYLSYIFHLFLAMKHKNSSNVQKEKNTNSQWKKYETHTSRQKNRNTSTQN